jgi:hypothetical protein
MAVSSWASVVFGLELKGHSLIGRDTGPCMPVSEPPFRIVGRPFGILSLSVMKPPLIFRV